MNSALISPPRRRRRTWAAVALAAAVGATALGSLAAPDIAQAAPDATTGSTPAPTAATPVTSGTLEWGVRASIRNYLENFDHTAGWIEARNGATYRKGDPAITFTGAEGWVDVEQQTAQISFEGEVQMFGFGEDWLWFEDVRVNVDSGDAQIVADIIQSYNVKERRDDVVLSTFEMPADSVGVEGGTLQIDSDAGKFTEPLWNEHLPQLGGAPTYGPPNDYTDPFTVTATVDDSPAPTPGPEPTPGPTPEPTTPGPSEPPPSVPGEGPYGTSTGTPLSGTDAYITVTPGYALDTDGTTRVRVEGFNFDPGTATEPGTGSGGIYVVLGQAAEPDTENWRRSKGGRTGPGQDLDYALPRFVANHNSADGDVADAVMNADGYWSYTVDLPGSTLESFFGGGPIDCLESRCGFYSFGAHGAVNLHNEAATLIGFPGDGSEDTWPPREDDTDTPPVAAPHPLPADDQLTDATRGGLTEVGRDGRALTVQIGREHAGEWVGATLHPDPTFISWYRVGSDGAITVTLPSTITPGAFRLSVVDREGTLLGWLPFTYAANPNPSPNPPPGGNPGPGADKEPHGSSTGENPMSGAKLTVEPAYELEDEGQKVTLTGEGYPTSNNGNSFGGAYILFGWIDPDLGDRWGPSGDGVGGHGYVYIEGEENQSMVSYPGNTTVPGYPVMDENGDWEAEFTIASSRFTAFGKEVDCYEVQCGVFTIGAHGQANAGVEVFTPVYFDADGSTIDPGGRPGSAAPGGSGPGTLAPAAGGPAGLKAATGLVSGSDPAAARLLALIGLLVMAGGSLGLASLWATRPVPRL
ncbi:HtaA domain-containing protein [uncultured Aeromicrobium sp.]|uniref:HtaA domain-containing protein n=1 Tax=uncultured Aeromicrobium sp. TaxID=337820 RepID=UPI0025F8B308|nr:HtaA domain-containing protein [uncultured Aeromicrobium sp.]